MNVFIIRLKKQLWIKNRKKYFSIMKLLEIPTISNIISNIVT